MLGCTISMPCMALLLDFSMQAYSLLPLTKLQMRQRKLGAHSLNTAFEWLADDRESKESSYSCLSWLDPASNVQTSTEADAEMPLYPIGAVYLPSRSTHFLNNVEPRNIQMALDLDRVSSDRKFCVVLSAADTGRIASVGTVMSILEIDKQYYQESNQRNCDEQEQRMIRAIRVTCRPEAIVDIESIVNPEAASWENRIKKSPSYLKARVRYRYRTPLLADAKESTLVGSILSNYSAVRDLYLGGVGTRNLPPFAVNALKEAMPKWTRMNFADDHEFWCSLEQWQTLCNTVRESQQMKLSTDRNEIMVAAVSAKGGPLKLPIHESDLPPEVRRQLQQMEVQSQQCFQELGMDPCLDFQVILSLPTYHEKLKFLLMMISRERERLQSIRHQASEAIRFVKGYAQPRRGAWFDDSLWGTLPDSEGKELNKEMNFNSTQVN